MGPSHSSTHPLGTRWCHFTLILPEFSQHTNLSSCFFVFFFFHRLSFWYIGCSQCGEWLVSGLGEKRGFLQTRNGVFPGNQHSLFVPVCKKILNLRVRCLYGNRDEAKLLQTCCECELDFLSHLAGEAWITCCHSPMPGEISVSLQWGSGPLCSEIPLMP